MPDSTACFEVETARLRLIALQIPHLRLLLADPERLEELLGLHIGYARLPDELRSPVEGMLASSLREPSQYLWSTDWQIVVSSQRRVVGGFCFKGPPGASGEVEIGYGLLPGCCGHGYMTEAVSAIAPWALRQRGVRQIIAETDKDNVPSQRVLQRSGFGRFRETESAYWWRSTTAAVTKSSTS